jgi:solute carrier family 25 (peroxisomal adenine nucleotide transporter), member 17
MAKVRIQARSADAETAAEEHTALPQHNKPHHQHGSGQHGHVGALDILGRVWKHQGFKGWYQVRRIATTYTDLSELITLRRV